MLMKTFLNFFIIKVLIFIQRLLSVVGTAPVNIPKPGASTGTGTHLGCLCPKE